MKTWNILKMPVQCDSKALPVINRHKSNDPPMQLVNEIGPVAFLLVTILALLFTNVNGSAVTWNKTFGGSDDDESYCVEQTNDDGYILAGYTTSDTARHCHACIIRLDRKGAIVWEKTYGQGSARCVDQTTDGGFVVAGSRGGSWLMRIDSLGNKMWDVKCGGTTPHSVQQTDDGGYILAGYHNYIIPGYVMMNILLKKLDTVGMREWNAGPQLGEDYSEAFSVRQTSDGGYVVVGRSRPSSSDVPANDVWVAKCNRQGEETWTNKYGGDRTDEGYSGEETSDGGYIIVGSTDSFGAGKTDVWLMKLDSSGEPVWQKTFGGAERDVGYSVEQTRDGGYVVAATTWSFGAGGADAWLIKIDNQGNKLWDHAFGGSEHDRAKSVRETSDGGYIAAGFTESYGAGQKDVWVIKIDGNQSQVNHLRSQHLVVDEDLFAIHPNPITGTFRVQIPSNMGAMVAEEAVAVLRIYDIGGRVVREFGTGWFSSKGRYVLHCDATDSEGGKMNPGNYVLELLVDGSTIVRDRIFIHR